MGWVDPWVGLGWVSQLMGWVGSGHTKWTHGQLWYGVMMQVHALTLHTTPGYPLAVHAERNLVATGSTIHTAVMVWDLDRIDTTCTPDIKVLSTCSNSTNPPSHTHTHARTHAHTCNGPLSGTTRVSRYQKGKTDLDFTEVRDSEWQWHQLGRMQVCTLLQTDNHDSTPSLSFFDDIGHWPVYHSGRLRVHNAREIVYLRHLILGFTAKTATVKG